MILKVIIDLRRDTDGSFFAATCPAFDELLRHSGGPLQTDLGDAAFVFYGRKKSKIAPDAIASILVTLAGRIRSRAALPNDTDWCFRVEWKTKASTAPEDLGA